MAMIRIPMPPNENALVDFKRATSYCMTLTDQLEFQFNRKGNLSALAPDFFQATVPPLVSGPTEYGKNEPFPALSLASSVAVGDETAFWFQPSEGPHAGLNHLILLQVKASCP